MNFLRQNTATVRAIGTFPDPTTGAAVTTLASQSGRLMKAGVGSAFTPVSWAHDYGGHYLIGFAAGDVDTPGELVVAFNSASYLPVWKDFTVFPQPVYDWMFGSSGIVPANIVQVGGVAAGTSDGMAQVGSTATTIKLALTASTFDSVYVDSKITLVAGTGAGQSRVITGYVGATRVATVQRAWEALGTPDATTAYAIDPTAAAAGMVVLGTGLTVSGGTATSFTATGSGLVAKTHAYDAGQQSLKFESGPNATQRRLITSHIYSAGVHSFVVSPGFTDPPGADTFVVA